MAKNVGEVGTATSSVEHMKLDVNQHENANLAYDGNGPQE